jgi:ABC-type uncharacterized transport system permease subunit
LVIPSSSGVRNISSILSSCFTCYLLLFAFVFACTSSAVPLLCLCCASAVPLLFLHDFDSCFVSCFVSCFCVFSNVCSSSVVSSLLLLYQFFFNVVSPSAVDLQLPRFHLLLNE